jgi:hypothetical protein
MIASRSRGQGESDVGHMASELMECARTFVTLSGVTDNSHLPGMAPGAAGVCGFAGHPGNQMRVQFIAEFIQELRIDRIRGVDLQGKGLGDITLGRVGVVK